MQHDDSVHSPGLACFQGRSPCGVQSCCTCGLRWADVGQASRVCVSATSLSPLSSLKLTEGYPTDPKDPKDPSSWGGMPGS